MSAINQHKQNAMNGYKAGGSVKKPSFVKSGSTAKPVMRKGARGC